MNRQGIEGVPAHLKVIAFRAPKTGEYYRIGNWDTPLKARAPSETYVGATQIVEPDNVYGVYALADVKIPAGYEFVEFRAPVEYVDSFVNRYGELVQAAQGLRIRTEDRRRIIVKPVAKKTKRVLVVEEKQLYPLNAVTSVILTWDDGGTYSLPFRIEEREVS